MYPDQTVFFAYSAYNIVDPGQIRSVFTLIIVNVFESYYRTYSTEKTDLSKHFRPISDQTAFVSFYAVPNSVDPNH